MIALVTGGAGFLGIHLSRLLCQSGWRVRLMDSLAPQEPIASGMEFLQGDICDLSLLRKACRGIDALVHCAALVPLTRAGGEFLRVNTAGSETVLKAACAERVRKVIYLSSSTVYGRPADLPVTESSPMQPLSLYGRSKRLAEAVCLGFKERGLDVTIIRPRPLIGPGRLGILQILWDWVRAGSAVYILGSGDNRFQLCSARDCARLCVLAAEKPCFQEDFNVGAERFTTLRKDLEALAAHAGTGSRIVPISPAWARPALSLLDRLRLSPFVEWHYKTIDANWHFDTSKARALLDWRPEDSNVDMLASAYDWYLKTVRAKPHSPASAHRSPVPLGILSLLSWRAGREE